MRKQQQQEQPERLVVEGVLTVGETSDTIKRPEQDGDTQRAETNHLDRRLSAPARLKQGLAEQAELEASTSAQSSASSAATTPRLGRCSECADQSARQRRAFSKLSSHREHKFRHHHHHNRPRQHKSASPLSSSSSSASDSAFSQSQTTLGWDSERSSIGTITKCLPNDAGTPLAPADSSNDLDDHFKIIWQDLSYRVPEKKFSRLWVNLARAPELWSLCKAKLSWRKQAADNCNSLAQVAAPEHLSGAKFQLEDLEEGAAAAVASEEEEAGLKCSPSANKQRQVIFSNLNGCVESGQLTAILGPSGAGKTTLLRCLTSNVVDGVSGRISIVGGSKSSRSLKLCIIPQKDYLFDNLTVMENLLFASRIKNIAKGFNHKENVHHVAGLLGLHACLRLKTSRLSGGQYKRVSIAQELLSQPDILILDEPTSGLDSLTCFRTVSVLKELVDLSRKGLMAPLAIIMTIHQPQIKIFNLFNRVYIISSMGQCVYEGKPEFLTQTVAKQCNLLPPPDDQNPASFIIDLASQVYGQRPIDELASLQLDNFLLANKRHLVHSNQSSLEEAQKKDTRLVVAYEPNEGENIVQAKQQQQAPLYVSERLRKRNNHEQSFWLHTNLLIRRLWISMWRDSLLTTTRVVFHFIIPFVFYFVYSHKSGTANACPHVERELDIQDLVSDTNIQRLVTQHDELILTFENVSLFFLLLYSFSMCVLAVTALSFPLNMQILLKETSNGWYTMPRFVMAKTLADLPIELTMPTISISIAYAITGQPSSYLCWRMLAVTSVMTLCSLISQTQGLLFGAYFMNNVQAAVFVSQASTLPWIMLSGFTTRVSELPRILQWLSFGSIYRLGIESIVAVRYGFGMCPCEDDQVKDMSPKIVGIPEQLRSLLSYYMDSFSSSSSSSSQAINTEPTATATVAAAVATLDGAAAGNNSTQLVDFNETKSGNKMDVFEKIATTLSRANTYGVDIKNCNDVRPFIMSAREVDESSFVRFVIILLTILIGLKLLLFFVVRIRVK